MLLRYQFVLSHVWKCLSFLLGSPWVPCGESGLPLPIATGLPGALFLSVDLVVHSFANSVLSGVAAALKPLQTDSCLVLQNILAVWGHLCVKLVFVKS